MDEKDHNALFYDLKALNSLEYVGLQLKISNIQNSQSDKVETKTIDIRKQTAITIKNELAEVEKETKRLKNSLNRKK
jgi:hypothetical protein